MFCKKYLHTRSTRSRICCRTVQQNKNHYFFKPVAEYFKTICTWSLGYENPDSSFSGIILVQNWTGDNLGTYQYTNGKVYNMTLDTTSTSKTTVNQTGSNRDISVTTCN